MEIMKDAVADVRLCYGEGECLNVKGQWKIKEQRKQSKAAFIT